MKYELKLIIQPLGSFDVNLAPDKYGYIIDSKVTGNIHTLTFDNPWNLAYIKLIYSKVCYFEDDPEFKIWKVEQFRRYKL